MNARKQTKKHINHISLPLEALWDDTLPRRTKILAILVMLHPKKVDNQSLANVLGCTRRQVQDDLKVMAKRGQVARDGGAVWLPDSLPVIEATDSRLNCLRGLWGRLGPSNTIPTPLRGKLEGRRKAALLRASWRLSPKVLSWMDEQELHEPAEFWAFQVPGLLAGMSTKAQGVGSLLAERAGEQLDPEEAVVTYVATAVHLASENRPVVNFGGMYTTVLRGLLDSGPADGKERSGDTMKRWLMDLQEHPIDRRTGIGDHLEALTAEEAPSQPQEPPEEDISLTLDDLGV